jgi:hypothetical protein
MDYDPFADLLRRAQETNARLQAHRDAMTAYLKSLAEPKLVDLSGIGGHLPLEDNTWMYRSYSAAPSSGNGEDDDAWSNALLRAAYGSALRGLYGMSGGAQDKQDTPQFPY